MNHYPRPVACLLALVSWLAVAVHARAADGPGRWSQEKANTWLSQHGWLAGCNFTPSTAINQLEMWQAATFDEATIDRELGMAAGLGFNSVRVYLHDLAWKEDPDGFLKRVDRFLALAAKHKIGTLLTIFDSCWHPLPKAGPQPAPLPHTHNSGWVQSPGVEVLKNPGQQAYLRDYVIAVVKRFANDPRVQGWDVWNEPENGDGGAPGRPGLEPKNKAALVLALLPKTFAWAREANPSQPLTSAVWLGDWSSDEKLSPMQRVQLENSDVISFHNYGKFEDLRKCVESLRRYGRPVLCTEFMARPNGSTFEPHLAYLKEQKVAAYCWGFVAGKTQTIYPWDSWKKKYESEPPVWFHDILRADGTPFRAAEADYIRQVTAKQAPKPDGGQATYRNPVERGDYPDPSVIRVGEEYYGTATSSEWGPQFPLLHSRDLVNWRMIGTVFAERPKWAEANFWAPELCEWKGKYFLYYVGRKRGGPLAVAVASAPHPKGPWTDHGPLIGQEAGSIDGMAVDDEKGQRWLVWKEDGNSRKQPTPIWAQRLDEHGTKLIGDPPRELLRNDAPWEGPLIEGPFIFRRGNWFYMLYAGNACCGRGCNYGVGVARAKTFLGPWEKCPRNPIMATNADFRGPGHGSVVSDPQGRLFFFYHAYDAKSFIYTGREMMLDEITFADDGWPAINGGQGASVSASAPLGVAQKRDELTFVDEFKDDTLQPGWQWPQDRPPQMRVDPRANGGVLVVQADAAKPLGAAVARFCTSADYVATTAIEAIGLNSGAMAGLSAFGDAANALGLVTGGGEVAVWQVQKGQRKELARTKSVDWPLVHMRMTAKGRNFQFAISSDGQQWKPIGETLDGDYLPPWDRSIRIALIAGGAAGTDARFRFLRIEPTSGVPAD